MTIPTIQLDTFAPTGGCVAGVELTEGVVQ